MSTINDSEKNIIYSSYDEYDSSVFILNDNDLVLNPKNDVKGGYSRTKTAIFKTVASLVLLFTILGSIAFSSAPALADEEPGGDCGPFSVGECVSQLFDAFSDSVKGLFCAVGGTNGSAPEMAAGGVGGLFTAPAVQIVKTGQGLAGNDLDTSKPYTAYEKYGTSGTNWTFYRDDIEGIQDYSCFPVDKVVSNLIANGIFSITEMISVFAAWSYGFATGTDRFDGLIESIDKIMGNGNDGGLVDTLYLNYLTPLLVLGALWLFWVGIIKRAFSRATSGIIWMVLSTITSLAILYNASGLIGLANGVVQNVVAETTGSIGAMGATKPGAKPNDLDDLCYLPGSGSMFNGSNSAMVERTVKCRIWEAFVYFPWATGQFGVPPNQAKLKGDDITSTIKLGPGNSKEMDVRAAQLDAQSLDYTLNYSEMGAALPKKVENYKKIEKFMTTDETARGFVSTWSGNDGMNRIGIAIFSIISAIGGTIIIISISVSMIVYQLGSIFLMLVAPLFLLLGAHPGFGRGIALKWAELLVESILKRIVLAIFISVIISVFIFLVGNTGEIGFVETIFLLIAMSIAGMMYKDKFTGLVGQLNFGGTQTGMEGGGQKMRSVLLGTAGAVAGGVGAMGSAGTAGRAARSLAKTQGLKESAQRSAANMAKTRAVSRGVIGGYSGGSVSKTGVGSLAKGAMAGRFNSQGSEVPYEKEEDAIHKGRAAEKAEAEKIRKAEMEAEQKQAEAQQREADQAIAEQERQRKAMHDMSMYNAISTMGGMLAYSLFPNMKKPEARAHGGSREKAAIDTKKPFEEDTPEQRKAGERTSSSNGGKPEERTSGDRRPQTRTPAPENGRKASSDENKPSTPERKPIPESGKTPSPDSGSTTVETSRPTPKTPSESSSRGNAGTEQTRRTPTNYQPNKTGAPETIEGEVVSSKKTSGDTTKTPPPSTTSRPNINPQSPKTRQVPPSRGQSKVEKPKDAPNSTNTKRSQSPKIERSTGSPLISRDNNGNNRGPGNNSGSKS